MPFATRRSGLPVTVVQPAGNLPTPNLTTGGYGNALTTVYGTAKVPGQMAFLATGLDQRVQVNDVLTKNSSGTWNTTQGFVAPAEVAFCQGPVAGFPLNWWRGSDVIAGPLGPSFLTHNSIQVGDFEWHNGDGTETAWTYLTSSYITTAKTETVSVAIGPQDNGQNCAATYTVDPTASWAGDVSVKNWATANFSVERGWTPTTMARVTGTPAPGQYSVTNGVYTFPGNGWNSYRVDITFVRDFSKVAGYGATAGALRNTAHLRAKKLAIPDGNSFPDISAEIKGFCANAPNGLDAHPADVLLDLWTSPNGLTLSASQIDVDHGPDGNTSSGFRAYCTAMGFYVSRAITSQQDAGSLIKDLLLATNSRGIWSGGKFKVVPLGDTAVGGYAPATNATVLSGSEFIVASPGDDPITVQRTAQSDVFNVWPVTFNQRYASGSTAPVYESANVEAVVTDPHSPGSIRRASSTTLDWVTNAGHAWAISYLLGLQSLYVRNTYRFTLGPRWALLEPGDLVSLTEPVMGLSGTPARIATIEEKEDGSLDVQAEEWPLGTGHPIQSVTQAMDGLRATTIGTTGYTTSYALQAIESASYSAFKDLSNLVSGVNNFDNLFPNPNSEGTAPDGAVLTGPAWSNVRNVGTGTAYAGSSVRAITAQGTNRFYEIVTQVATGPGEAFYIEAQARRNAEGSNALVLPMPQQLPFLETAMPVTGNAAYVGVRFWDVGGAQLGQTITSTTSSAWNVIKVSGTAPASAIWCDLLLGLDAQATSTLGSEVWFDSIYARRQIGSDIVQAGSITAKHIQAGSISGSNIAAGTITADKLSANAFQTSNYQEDGSGNPIAGAKLDSTGTTLKVAPGASPVKWADLPLINGWSAVGECKYSQNAAGEVSLRGTVTVSTLTNVTIGTLPVGMRPTVARIFPIYGSPVGSSPPYVSVKADGSVIIGNSQSTYIYFVDPVRFQGEQ